MKQWEDWIIFLGFRDEHYGNAVDAIGKWKGTLTWSGLNGDDLRRLNDRLFNGPDRIIQYSCCLGLGSMRVANGVIEAGWVDGGGLSLFDKEYEKVKGRDFSDTYRYPYGRNIPVHFLDYGQLTVIGMTLDGKPVIDTFKEYGDEEDRDRRMRGLGFQAYCEEFLETVKKNYAKALLPPVPKGILKLPSAFRQGD